MLFGLVNRGRSIRDGDGLLFVLVLGGFGMKSRCWSGWSLVSARFHQCDFVSALSNVVSVVSSQFVTFQQYWMRYP